MDTQGMVGLLDIVPWWSWALAAVSATLAVFVAMSLDAADEMEE